MRASTKRRPTQKSEVTRQKLLEAAVTCLWKYGYANTTLETVAAEAGMSRGPQRYYFPTRIDLMLGVWKHLSEQLVEDYWGFDQPDLSSRERLDLMIDASIKRAGSRAHTAELELKLAIRGDSPLKSVLSPLINRREQDADERWVKLFKDTGRSRSDLIATRYMLVSMVQGLAIQRATGRPTALLKRIEKELRDISHELMGL